MSLLSHVKRGPTVEPVRGLLHGQEGVGKTTFAADCPDALTLTVEDGGGDLDYARIVIPTWKGLRQAVWDLISDGPGDFRTLFIDTIDSYERLLFAHICKEAWCDTIEEVGGGFGKGYVRAAEEMSALAADLDELRTKHRMNVWLLAHSHVKTFNDPLGNPFDRYEVKLDKRSAGLWLGWADCILFAAFEVTVKTAKRNAPIDVKGKAESGRRVLYTTKDPAYDAKNRFNLPEELPLTWRDFARAIRWDERMAAIRAPKQDPSFAADRAAWSDYLAELGEPYRALNGKSLEDTIAEFIAAGNLPLPSTIKQDGRTKYRALLATEECRKAFIAWEVEGAIPPLRAIGRAMSEAAAAK